jgi:hypothetical protein
VLGDWATGDHTVSINFLNDAWGFTFDTDRNLYLDGASYGGAPIANSHLAFMGAGPQEFDFHLGSPTPATPTSPVLPATPTGTGAGSSPSSLTIGAGAQQLVLRISEDAYQGDARYTVSVDGHQIGGTQTAHSLHAAGQSDIVTVLGDWGTGDHTVSINFLNDAWGFTFDTDRNLYLDGASYGAAPIANSHLAFMGIGPQEFDFHLL